MRLKHYLITAQEYNDMIDEGLFIRRAALLDNNKAITTDEADLTARLDKTGIINTYTLNRCPRYQDVYPIYECPFVAKLMGTGELGEIKEFELSDNGISCYNSVLWDFGTLSGNISFTVSNFFNQGTGTPKLEFIYDGVVIHTINGITNSVYSFVYNYSAPAGQLVKLKITVPGNSTTEFSGFTFDVECPEMSAACATCTLDFDSFTDNTLSIITAGNLTSPSCTVGDYAIEWRLGSASGPVQFTSGNNAAADPAITVLHPIAAEPTQGGEYFPVIKFVFLDGVKYVSSPTPYVKYSPDLETCLEPITVQNYSCENGGTGKYAHTINYVNNVNSSTLASRTLRFDLNATTQFIAWTFTGASVPDNIKISYVSPTNSIDDELEYWRIGTDNVGNDYSISPKRLDSNVLSTVLSLEAYTFAAGDFLRIEVSPNVGNTNTNWTLGFKCLNTYPDCPTCDAKLVREYDMNSFTMTWNPATCNYEVRWQRLNTCAVAPNTNTAGNFGYYHSLGSSNVGAFNAPTNATIAYDFSRNTTSSNFVTHTQSDCAQLEGTARWIKSGSTLTVEYSDVDDYNSMKGRYTTINSSVNFVNYSTDPTNINHYKWWTFSIRVAALCGDAFTLKSISTHYSNVPVFDDINRTMTINLSNVTNGYIDVACSSVYETLQNRITNINNGLAQADFDLTTSVRSQSSTVDAAMVGAYNTISVNGATQVTLFTQYPVLYQTVCDLAAYNWSLNSPNGYPGQYTFIGNYERITITDNTDPENNWRVESATNLSGDIVFPVVWRTIYEKAGGVVIIP